MLPHCARTPTAGDDRSNLALPPPPATALVAGTLEAPKPPHPSADPLCCSASSHHLAAQGCQLARAHRPP